MAFYMPPLPTGQSAGRNTRRTAETIQIGDSVKPAHKTQYLVVENIAFIHGEYPKVKFLLEDGTTFESMTDGFIWWRAAGFAA